MTHQLQAVQRNPSPAKTTQMSLMCRPSLISYCRPTTPPIHLPPNLAAYTTTSENHCSGEAGRGFYHNEITGKSQWTIPTRAVLCGESASSSDEAYTSEPELCEPDLFEPDLFELECIEAANPSLTKFKVKWMGYPASESTWEPASSLSDELIKAWKAAQHPPPETETEKEKKKKRKRKGKKHVEQDESCVVASWMDPGGNGNGAAWMDTGGNGNGNGNGNGRVAACVDASSFAVAPDAGDLVVPGTGVGLYNRPKVPRVYVWEVERGSPDGPGPRDPPNHDSFIHGSAAAARARQRKPQGPGCTVRIFDNKELARKFLACSGRVIVTALRTSTAQGAPVRINGFYCSMWHPTEVFPCDVDWNRHLTPNARKAMPPLGPRGGLRRSGEPTVRAAKASKRTADSRQRTADSGQRLLQPPQPQMARRGRNPLTSRG